MEHTPLELQLMQENAALREENARLVEANAALREEFAAYRAATEERIEQLLTQVDQLRHLVFGRKSEKAVKVPSLAAELRANADGETPAPKTPDREKGEDHPRRK